MVMVNYLAWNGDDWAREDDFGENGIIVRESMDGGLTFGDPVDVTQYGNASGSPHNHIWLIGLSALYVGEDLHLTWVEQTIGDIHPIPHEALRIMHWSPAVNNGIPTVAVTWDAQHFAYWEGDPQIAPMDFPHIGVDEDGVLTIVFCSFPPDTTVKDPETGYLYSDIFAVSSADNGYLWGEPVNLTNSPQMDDRFPYISEWNEAGKINVLYQTDTKTGQISNGSEYVGEVDYLFLKTEHGPTKQITFEDEYFWQTVTQMGTPRFFCTATEVDDKIYVIGGSECIEAIPLSSVGTNEVLNTTTHTWTTVAPMPTPRSDHAACSYNGKIYIFGGYNSYSENTLNTVEVYDPATDTWEQKSDMPMERSGFAAFVYNDKIYTIGGHKRESGVSELNGALAVYDPATDAWSAQSSPNLPAYNFAACLVGDNVFAAGGIGPVEDSDQLSDNSFVLDLDAQAFTSMSRITASRCYLSSAFLNEVIYYIGGSTQSYPQHDAQNIVDIFLPNDNFWLEGKELPSPRYGHASCVAKNRIYVFGGKTIIDGTPEWNTDVDVYTETLISDIKNPIATLPSTFQLYQNFPNPFNPSTTITFDCPVFSHVTLEIYDLLGRRVKTLVDNNRTAGHHTEVWDTTDEFRRAVSSGVYLAVLQGDTFEQSIKLVLMK